jgi:endonuclease/exonuclease/phosphatase family metal-dependent hydrolase
VDETISVLRGIHPDVLILNEVISPGGALLRVADELEMHCSFAPSGFGGNAVLTRSPQKSHQTVLLHARGGGPRSGLVVNIDSEGQPVRIVGTHLDDRSEHTRLKQLEQLLEALESTDLPQILAGDLNALRLADYPNDVLESISAFRRRNGREEPGNDVMNALDAHGYVDAVRLALCPNLAAYEAGLSTPLPERLRSTCWAGTRIDHICLNPRAAAIACASLADIVDTDVSDHFPAYVDLELSR